MQNIIQLLPDAIANQIAAGEVVQRPASVVKELLENAIDAGAGKIDIYIKNAGKTLIQVSDDGCGMSAQDARMSFERHATSKVRTEEDLQGIRTLGFRGEALASIAAVAQVKLKTRKHEEELGAELDIDASEIKSQLACTCPPGTLFQVKNLFHNVPARRNFLKSNPVESRHILNEFIRIAIPNSGVKMTLKHNDTQVYDLPAGTIHDRIISLFGKDLKGQISGIEEATGYVKISGFIGQPTLYRKNRGEQFFFVNNRYIRSNYLNHAIMQAYKDFIPAETHPFYCIFLEIDPKHVDINIHPTKTEVKFDDERTLYALLQSSIKQGLGDLHNAPEFDFTDNDLKDAIYGSSPQVPPQEQTVGSAFRSQPSVQPPPAPKDWDKLYATPDSVSPAHPRDPQMPASSPQRDLFGQTSNRESVEEDVFLVQYQQTYILTQRSGKLYIIDQHLAHERILYERFLAAHTGMKLSSQQLLFPQTIEFSAVDYVTIREVEEPLGQMGFELKEFGDNTLIVYGTPAEIPTGKIREIFEQILSDIREIGISQVQDKVIEGIARAVAQRSAVTSRQKLSILEMKNITRDLFKCAVPAFAPSGKPTFKTLTPVELEDYFH